MKTLLLLIPGATLMLIMWARGTNGFSTNNHPSAFTRTGEENLTAEDIRYLQRMADSVLSEFPDMEYPVTGDDDQRRLFALLMIGKDLLKRIASETDHAPDEWYPLMRHLEDTGIEIHRMTREPSQSSGDPCAYIFPCVCNWQDFLLIAHQY